MRETGMDKYLEDERKEEEGMEIEDERLTMTI